jgi:hypothetical protein
LVELPSVLMAYNRELGAVTDGGTPSVTTSVTFVVRVNPPPVPLMVSW